VKAKKKSGKVGVTIPKLHSGQLDVFARAKRFNVLRCGRRFGKTTLAIRLLCDGAIGEAGIGQLGMSVAYFAPTYKMLSKQWQTVKRILKPITLQTDSQLKQLVLETGGIFDFWSLENPDAPRGNAYDLIFVDEAAMIRNLKDTFEQVLLPLLTDREGSAWLGSTPRGENDFYALDQLSLSQEDWASFHLPTDANPFISKKELARMESLLPADVWNQEYAAEYVSFDGKTFLQYFKESEHVTPVKYRPGYDLFLSFDFNIANTVLLIQNIEEELWVLDEYHAELYDLEGLCEEIQANYPTANYIINGDASGRARSATSTNNASGYELIEQFLNLSLEQFEVPKSNPTHFSSYVRCNYVFRHFRVRISPRCKGLINDIKKVKVDQENNKFAINKKDPKLTHHLDPLRYHINAHWADRMPDVNTILKPPHSPETVDQDDEEDWD